MSHEADAFWAAALAIPAGYDWWAMRTGHETASSAMRRYTESPGRKFLLVGALAGLALHFVSEQYDPANLIFGRGNDETLETD